MTCVRELLAEIDKDRSNLIKALQAAQAEEGFISDGTIIDIAAHFGIAVVDVEGVVSFYAQFKRIKPGKYKISVCDGTACHIKGSSLVQGWISEDLHIKSGETDTEGLFSLETVACLGCCSLAPVISINGKVFGNLDRKGILKIIKTYRVSGGAA